MLGLPAWGVKHGYGSFLTFEFGAPTLHVEERRAPEKPLRRSAYVQGEWHLWVSCCHWRAVQEGTQLAWSDDCDRTIERATAALTGQKLLDLSVTPAQGLSVFTFDLGGSLETWRYGDDPTEEQWTIFTSAEVFAYRADGAYARNPGNTPPELVSWLPLA